MNVSILIFSYRKAGVTSEDFRTQTEDVLVPLLKEITEEHFPLSHKRRYIQHTVGYNPLGFPLVNTINLDLCEVEDSGYYWLTFAIRLEPNSVPTPLPSLPLPIKLLLAHLSAL